MTDQIEQEIQQLISQAQHLLHQAETRAELLGLKGARNEGFETSLDAAQRSLVDAQLSFVQGKIGEELLSAFFSKGPVADLCQVSWSQEKLILKIFIPDSWERIHTRPSIYIKDILKNRNASSVKLFYTRLIQAILEREKEKGKLEGFERFEKCFAGFLFHFQDGYVRDPDNFTIKPLVDAAKVSNIFLTDDYQHLVYTACGVRDQNNSGMTMYFSDSVLALNELLDDCERIKNGENHMRFTYVKLYSFFD